jgi:kinesin family member C1
MGNSLIGLPATAAEKPPFPPAMLESIQKRREQKTIENEALLEDVISLCNNNDEVDDLKKEIVGLEAKIVVFETESEATNDKIKSLTALQTSQDDLKRQTDSLQADKKMMGTQMESLETKLKEANEQLVEQKMQLQELKKVKGEAVTLQTEKESLQSTVANLEKKVRYLENVRIPELQILLNSEKDNVARYETETDTLQSELNDRNDKIQDLTDEVNMYKTNQLVKNQSDKLCASQQHRIETLEREVKEHKCTIEANLKTISDFTTTLKNAEDRFDTDRKTLNDALEDALNQFHTLERVKNALQKKAEDAAPLSATVETLNKQIADERSRLENTIVSKDQTIRQLEQKLRQASEDRDQARNNMQGFDDRENELYRKLSEGELIRRQMHGRIMQLMGNIRVFVRVRPLLQHEGEGKTPFSFPGACDGKPTTDLAKTFLELKAPSKDRGGLSDRRTTHRFVFDKVFGPNINQDGIWDAVEPLIQCAVDGSAVTIFAYGQTGSGVSTLPDKSSNTVSSCFFSSVENAHDARRRRRLI